MEEDTEYKKLPIDERCVHKLWKARVDGYEEATKLFREIDDEKSPEWSKYLGLIKKFVNDSNAMAQEKGLEATLVFVENCGHAGKTVGEVISGIVSKCIAAPKAKTKDLAVQVSLMYIEIEKHESVIEELLKGIDHKNPKISSGCTALITLALKEFGIKVINVKPIIKKIPILLTDRDKTVRDEGKQLTIEIFRWIGQALKPQLASLAPVLVTELETEFEKLKGGKAVPTRYLRSQQEKQIAVAAAQAEECDDVEEGNIDQEEIDPMDSIDPVDILSKLPKDFFEKIEAKKWQERKEALDALEMLLQNPKLESGDYGDLVRALKKVLSKDTNVVLVALSGKCMASLAKGIGKKFQIYSGACVPAILEKFKEKKPNVVSALREAIDAIYPSTNLDAMQEDILEALNNKNPSVKAETTSFLARAFTKTLPTIFNKKLLKIYVTALLKTLNEPDPIVRDNSADAIGTIMKLVGEKGIAPYLSEVDSLKMIKIKECCEKAVIVIKVPGVKKERPATAPVKNPPVQKAGSTQAKPAVKRPATASAGNKKPVIKKPIGGGSTSALAKSASSAKVLPTERDMSIEEIVEKAAEILPPDVISGLSDTNWKTRLAAMESFINVINDLEDNCGHSQVLIRTLANKPGLKDTNFQVLKIKLDAIKIIIQKMGITVTTSDYIIIDVTEKLGDTKNSTLAFNALTAIAEAIRLDYVVSKVMEYAFEQKSPKVQQETLIWVNTAIREFGFQVNPKMLLDDVKKAVQITNPVVRAAGIVLIGTMYLYMGNSLIMFFDSEKPALKQQIQTECDKNADQKPPIPFRGTKNCVSGKDGNGNEDDDEMENNEPVVQINVADLLPRIDIGPQITEALLTEIADKNWKTRNEGLTKLQAILNDAKLIKPSIGDLAQALSQRLIDSNAKIAQTSLAICQQLATSMGPPCRQHVRTLFPGFLHGLGDNKSFIRTASITCINIWGDQCGYKEFFESEMIADALKIGGPALRTELWGWLAEKLPPLPPKSFQKEELVICLPYLYANICDRNADVRKNANEAILGIMIHLGFDCMVKALDKQKPTSKKDIQAALEKARPNLPIKPLPKNKQQAPIIEEKSIRGGVSSIGKPRPASAVNNKTAAPVASRKKEEEVDTSPLLAINNTKNQRLIDEQKLRVLKWTFTQPREEFIELLREQMMTANVNRGLIANMFHDDFRYHLKAIEALIEDLPNNEKALISNLDLILKWVSLRFYDTNPSVLLKGLDYLNQVFTMLTEMNYVLAENEGNSFMPHLLIKIGDPKDAVRNGVRQIIRQICLIFPITKTFAFVMEGLKSKNARQRTECLDELGYLIANYGITVCQPTPQVALKEIARHISDRDNSVRSAALNCIVQGYFLAGDKIYKLIGQMTEKDLSMLDERIKRAKRPKKNEQTNQQSVSPSQDNIEVQEIVQEEEELPSEEISPMVVTRQFEPIIQQKPSGPFKLDPDIVAEIEKDWLKSDQIQEKELQKVDISFLYSPLRVISRDGICYPKDKFEKLISNQQSMPPLTGYSSVSPSSQINYNNYQMSPTTNLNNTTTNNVKTTNLADTIPKLDPNLLRIILAIGNKDTIVARAAINELNDILESSEKQAVLRDYEETYIQSVLQQFKNLSQHSFNDSLNDSLVMYQQLLASTLTFFNSKHLGKNLSITSLKNIMSVLLGLMADHKLANGDYTKVINGICLKILDRTNFTNLNCALIRLLKETCSSAGLPKFTDLLMKCIWRNVKVMPERSNDLNYDDVLLEVHEFMLALPTVWWQQRPSDTPLRTVKTIIHNMTKIKGSAILQHLNKIPSHSELHAYLIRILKNIQKDTSSNPANNNINNPGTSPQQQQQIKEQQSKRMTKQTHEAMSQIFKLISDKETNKEGLTKLYQFKMDNPDVDVVPFLKGASPCFQKFIEDGLADIERTHNIQDNSSENNKIDEQNQIHQMTGGNRIIHSSNNFKDADYYLEKLNSLRVKANLPSVSIKSDFKQVLDNKMADENLNMNQMPIKTLLLNKEKIPDLSANRRELLQQKLAQIKQQKNSH